MVNPVDVCWSFPTNLPIDTYVGGRVVYQCPICVRRCYDDSNYPTRKITDVEADETEST